MREHLLATGAALTTFALLLLGGVVHGTGSSLACPDWPTCYGEWMPPMTGGVLFEHSHRMLGAVVGLLTIVLAIVLHRRRRLVMLGWLAVVMVVFQGVLGGVTVLLRLPTAVSTAHLATAMGFFCLLLFIAWSTRPASGVPPRTASARLKRPAGLVLGAVYAQIVVGALVRHTGAGLACHDIPLCEGSLWPAHAGGAALLQMAHRIFGVVVAALVLLLGVAVVRGAAARASRVLAGLAAGLVLLQVTLGLLSVTSRLGLFEVTAHLGVGALILGACFLLYLSLPAAEESAPGVGFGARRGTAPPPLGPEAA